MVKTFNKAIHLFTRDLRIWDNTAFYAALRDAEIVYPCFIFNPVQIDRKINAYFSHNCVQFMCESLDDLASDLTSNGSKLYILHGNLSRVIKEICITNDIECIYMNKDYTPFAKSRSVTIATICENIGIEFAEYDDYLLLDSTDRIKTNAGDTYQKFTPFHTSALNINLRNVTKMTKTMSATLTQPHTYSNKFASKYILTKNHHDFYITNDTIFAHGGRTNALQILKKVTPKNFGNYATDRDYLSTATTGLSAYMKFNVVSIREVYNKIIKLCDNVSDNVLLKQLWWREFYMIIMDKFPHVIGNAMKIKYNGIVWENNAVWVHAWQTGTTGFPVVDAAMRQLVATGYMHNRGRMIVSNFLVKILHVDWQIGEKYFAQHLVDYDPANNNGGWQWSASTGTDSQPYFRYFNPYLQSKKYDEFCEYIKRWIPELSDVPSSDIHTWYTSHKKYNIKYQPPIVANISDEIQRTLKYYSNP